LREPSDGYQPVLTCQEVLAVPPAAGSEVRFSVVIPAYNASATIAQTIRSVFLQSEQDFEIIVVDDGSTDDTAEQVRSLHDRRLAVITQQNGGSSAARNRGVAAASGSYVCILDADDLWLPEYLKVMGAALDADPDAAFAYTDAWLLDDKTKRIRRTSAMYYERPPSLPLPDVQTLFLRVLERNFIPSFITYRRSVFDAVGGFDESLRVVQDWEHTLRVVRAGLRPVRPPGLLAIYRTHPSQLTKNLENVAAEHVTLYRRYAEDPEVAADVREVAQRKLAYWTTRADESFAFRARWFAFTVKRRLQRPWLWPRRRPPEVERTLRAVGEIPPGDGVS
jgi:glycosyltransferase involved in cell wall biosynthesis